MAYMANRGMIGSIAVLDTGTGGSAVVGSGKGIAGGADILVRSLDSVLTYLDPRLTPLLYILNMMGAEDTPNPKFEWPERTRVGMQTTIVTWQNWSNANAFSGTITNLAVADASIFQVTGYVYFPGVSNDTVATVTDVTIVTPATGAGTISLLLGPGGAGAVDESADGDYIINLGTVQLEGSGQTTVRTAVTGLKTNYTQIHRTDLEMTETAVNTDTYTGDEWDRITAEALQQHAEEWERIFLYGKAYVLNTGTQPKRFTGGLLEFISDYGVANSSTRATYDYDQFLEDAFELFEYHNGTRVWLCGPGFLTRISESDFLPENATITISKSETDSFGLEFQTLKCVWGKAMLVPHPLFAAGGMDGPLANVCISLSPDLIRKRPLNNRGTKQIIIPKNAHLYDKSMSYIITEMGLQVKLAEALGFIELTT